MADVLQIEKEFPYLANLAERMHNTWMKVKKEANNDASLKDPHTGEEMITPWEQLSQRARQCVMLATARSLGITEKVNDSVEGMTKQ